jgi:hypothetical protein
MDVSQSTWSEGTWSTFGTHTGPPDAVLVFGGREVLQHGAALSALGKIFPADRIYGCSTAGEILGTHVQDGTCVATAVWLQKSKVVAVQATLQEAGDAVALGRLLAQRLGAPAQLAHAFVLSDGLRINGSQLVRGLTETLPTGVTLSGGLSGDDVAMQNTVVCHGGTVASGTVTLLGFCGEIEVGIGSLGGWQAFGPIRRVTKSVGNVLHELDGEPALALYKRYLGPHAEGLPSSALLFPLQVTIPGSHPVVRTILGVSDAAGTMTFAGDVPEGATAQLMRANNDRLIDGAMGAATATNLHSHRKPGLALLVSCVGRKLVLKQRVEEELEAVAEVLGADVALTGFYSYGEVAPFAHDQPCQLHNQTLTITTLSEA